MTRLLVILAVLASTQISAAPLNPETVIEARQIADDAMKYVAADDMKGLFAFFAKHMPTDRDALAAGRDKSIEQRKTVADALGKPMGVAFVSECRRSDVLVRLLYAEKRERNVLRWEFIFFKLRNEWKLAYFYWDNNVERLFDSCT